MNSGYNYEYYFTISDYSEDFEPYDSIEAETSHCWQEEEDNDGDEDGDTVGEDEDLDDVRCCYVCCMGSLVVTEVEVKGHLGHLDIILL